MGSNQNGTEQNERSKFQPQNKIHGQTRRNFKYYTEEHQGASKDDFLSRKWVAAQTRDKSVKHQTPKLRCIVTLGNIEREREDERLHRI